MAVLARTNTNRANRMSWRQAVPLACLACAVFVFNSSEFMPMALLSDIALSFNVTESDAGMIISLYAWAVMILSLPLMMVGTRLSFRNLLLVVMAVFLAGQVASVLAPTFLALTTARLVVAAAHAVFWSIVTPVATRIVDEEHAPLAMSIIVGSSSVATIVGLPLGRSIGILLGWRATFLCIAGATALILVALTAFLPWMQKDEPFTLRMLPSLARNRHLIVTYGVTILVATGYYLGYSYIEPFLQQIGGMSDSSITLALSVFGCAGIVGSVLFSRPAHLSNEMRVGLPVFAICCALLLMAFASHTLVTFFAICVLWGAGSSFFNAALQSIILKRTSPESTATAMSIFSGLFNLGIGLGAWLGGLVINTAGIAWIGVAGSAVVFAGLGSVMLGALVCFGQLRLRAVE
ncbi:MAG: MFS transporter [Eggerthellaceae bacterium]|jgi:predicted MFS family arabinose efflux permease